MIIALSALSKLSASQDGGPVLSFNNLVATSACNDRKTSSIVWSCLTTIFVCVWIAIHPDLPFKGERLFVRRLKIFAIMLIAPELIVIWAMRQWKASHRLAHKYKDYGWTQAHGFFTIMGGFQNCGHDGRSFRILKPDELEPYLKDRTITISEEEILDKSKGDLLSKALLLLQVSWFITQVLARAIQHLDITELELVTLGYAILNFIVYFCWWKKPLDVHYPIRIHKQPDPSKPFSVPSSGPMAPIPGGRTGTTDFALDGNTDFSGHDHSSNESISSKHSRVSEPRHHHNLDRNVYHVDISLAESIPGALATRLGVGETALPNRPLPQSTPVVIPDGPVQIDLFPYLPLSTVSLYSGDNSEFPVGRRRQSWRISARNFAMKNFVEPIFALMGGGGHSEDTPYASERYTVKEQDASGYLTCVVATIFGVIHCLGWHFEFPSEAERLLWRISSLAITIIPPCFNLLLFAIDSAIDSGIHRSENPLIKTSLRVLKVIYYIGRIPFAASVYLYITSRIILLVLTFVVFRKPNPGIFTSVDWVNYIPHF